jgi:hypothetical protein
VETFHCCSPAAWPLECRRLFLRRWQPTGAHGLEETYANVEIWVRYDDATAERDELADVLDYNVMRDALVQSGIPDSWTFVDNALHELMKSPIQAARVELVYLGPGEHWRGSRYVRR